MGDGGGVAEWPASPLWDYAVDLYGRPGVREACLALQDRGGADVSLLLLACWLGAAGRRPGEAELSRLREEASRWQEMVVGPLRSARRALKERAPDLDEDLRHPVEAARRRLADVELDTERAELRLLERSAREAPATAAPGPELAAWCLARLAPPGSGDSREAGALLAAAFPQGRQAS